MRWISRTRMLVARRPWIHWSVVAALAVLVGASVTVGLAGVRRERDAWGRSRSVLVATREVAPGEPLAGAVAQRTVPVAAVPAAALSIIAGSATAVQRISVGEMIVETDVATASGPRALLPERWLAIDIADVSNTRLFAVGDPAAVLAGGRIVAADAIVVAVTDTDVVVGVPAEVAAVVADAANQRAAVVALSS